MTLLFSLVQAQACAEANITLISPFAGRITDFFKEKEKKPSNFVYPPSEDHGVKSVKEIYNYYKKHGYKTVVMGASFRTKEQPLELAGCDLLTISPSLLNELKNTTNFTVEKKLDPKTAATECKHEKFVPDEKAFRWFLNEDEMATIKLAEGIRRFAADLIKLEEKLKPLLV